MGHHRLNAVVINIGRGLRISQHELGIEKIQAFVFHGARIEIGNGNNHEPIKIELQPKAFFVPKDCTL